VLLVDPTATFALIRTLVRLALLLSSKQLIINALVHRTVLAHQVVSVPPAQLGAKLVPQQLIVQNVSIHYSSKIIFAKQTAVMDILH
jgi:hypothetical protein